jgi:hypothetical protein
VLKNSSFGPGGQIFFSPYRSISLFWQGDRPDHASRVARPHRVVWFTILADFDRICGFDGDFGFSDFGVFQQNKPEADFEAFIDRSLMLRSDLFRSLSI